MTGSRTPTHIVFLFLFFDRERLTQIESKLNEVKAGRAPEYIQPLEELQVSFLLDLLLQLSFLSKSGIIKLDLCGS